MQSLAVTPPRRKIRLIDTNAIAKCCYVKKLTCVGTLRQMFICLRPPPLLDRFFWGGKAIVQVLNLVRNRVLNSCRIWSSTQLNSPPAPPSHTLSVYTVLTTLTMGEAVNQRVGQRSSTSLSQVENTNMTDSIYLQSINSIKHQ